MKKFKEKYNNSIKFLTKKIYLSIFFSLILFLSSSAFSLSLEESIAHAIKIDPKLQQSFSRIKTLQSDQDYSRGDYYPTLTLKVGAGLQKYDNESGNKIDDDAQLKEASLVLRQSLFTGLSTYYDVQSLGHKAESERLSLFSETESSAMDVINVYLNLVSANQLLQLSKLNQQDHEKIYEDVKVKVNNQLAPQSDLAQVASRVANSRASTIAAQNRVMDLEAEYMLLVGSPAENLIKPKPDTSFLIKTQQESVDYALANHFSIQSAVEKINSVNKDYKASASDYYPEIYIEASANYKDYSGYSNPAYPNQGDTEEMQIMLNMEFDVFSGGKRGARRDANSWRKVEATNSLKLTQRQIHQSVIKAWNSHLLLQEQMQYLKTNVDKSAIAAEGYEEQFKVGRRELLDLLISKTDLFQAKKAYLEINVQKEIATYQLMHAMGNLLKSLYIERPQEWEKGQ